MTPKMENEMEKTMDSEMEAGYWRVCVQWD